MCNVRLLWAIGLYMDLYDGLNTYGSKMRWNEYTIDIELFGGPSLQEK